MFCFFMGFLELNEWLRRTGGICKCLFTFMVEENDHPTTMVINVPLEMSTTPTKGSTKALSNVCVLGRRNV